jgi:hypothetical protein
MRFTSAGLIGCIVALGVAATAVEARVRVGVVVGVPGPWYPHAYYGAPYPYYSGYYGPGYYPPAYYPAGPAVVAVPSGPTTYIQQNPDANNGGDNDWYYCVDAKAYYPYVKQCPGGWARVAPKPAGAP